MRSLDLKDLHRRNAEVCCWMQKVSLWLQHDHLFADCDFCSIQVPGTDLSLIIQQKCFFQQVWLSQLKPESLLQDELDLTGDVATKHPGNLWKHHNQLCRSVERATQVKVSKLYGKEGAHIVSYSGLYQILIRKSNHLFLRGTSYTMLLKRTLLF